MPQTSKAVSGIGDAGVWGLRQDRDIRNDSAGPGVATLWASCGTAHSLPPVAANVYESGDVLRLLSATEVRRRTLQGGTRSLSRAPEENRTSCAEFSVSL